MNEIELCFTGIGEQLSVLWQAVGYAVLAPLCTISSSLFESTLPEHMEANLLILVLGIEWAFSAFVIIQLIRTRCHQSIFFYEFVFLLTMASFCLVGMTYSLLNRSDPMEQILAKVCLAMLLLLLSEKLVVRGNDCCADCGICMVKICCNERIVLRCGHGFHEGCYWDWLYLRKECPCCPRPVKA